MAPHLHSTRAWLVAAAATVALGWPVAGDAAVLQERTREAFDRYVRITEARIAGELAAEGLSLWIDRQPAGERSDLRRRLRAGEIVVRRLETEDVGRPLSVPDGLVHHWLGTAFMPGATLAETIALVQDYDRYAEIYHPAIRRARTVAGDGLQFTASMQLFMKKVVSVVLNADFDVRYEPLGPTRVFVRSAATRIAEVEDADGPAAREKPVGRDSGYLWRFNNYCTFDERDGGTWMQCESVSLSRDIPLGLDWLVGRFVSRIPQESLELTLGSTRRHLTVARSGR